MMTTILKMKWTKVAMVDISHEDAEYCQLNPLPKDSPVLELQKKLKIMPPTKTML